MKVRLLFILFILNSSNSFSQLYYGSTFGELLEININGTNCSSSVVGPFIESSSGIPLFAGDIAVCPNGKLYINNNQQTYEVNPANASCTLISSPPNYLGISGLGCSPNNELYGVGFIPGPGTLYEIDVVAGNTSAVGTMPFFPSGDIVFWGGNVYMASASGIVDVNVGNPSASTLLFPTSGYVALTVLGDDCDALVAGNGNSLTRIDLTTGAQTPLCNISQSIGGLTTPMEFTTIPFCPFEIDLDKNDDSGAFNFDFNSPNYSCLTENGIPIADEDVDIISSKKIVKIEISLSNILSQGFEYLTSSNTQNIIVNGNGTPNLVITNTGNATISNFLNVLKSIKYYNLSDPLSAGQREVVVVGTDELGNTSDPATAFIDVVVLPKISLELGDEIEKCDIDEVIIDTNVPNVIYDWSTGEITQSISILNAGVYSVTVSDEINCPNSDQVEVINNPTFELSLKSQGPFCPNEKAILNLNSSFLGNFDIEIIDQNGQILYFYNITNNFNIEVPNSNNSSFIIYNSSSFETNCLNNSQDSVTINFAPIYNVSTNKFLCSGDSLLLSNKWIKESGVYIDKLFSTFGCDSTITTNITKIIPDTISLIKTTCNPLLSGITLNKYKNKFSCDSLVFTNTFFKNQDTTFLSSSTCILQNAGEFSSTYQNNLGCDSVVVSLVKYIPSYTTLLYKKTCDLAQVGITSLTLQSSEGCDSTIVIDTKYIPSDTVLISNKTCDITKEGISSIVLKTAEGCDSVVITNTKLIPSDTTRINKKTCDITKKGITTLVLQSAEGCDSIVITDIKYISSDTTRINKKTCDITKEGITSLALQSIKGCDSIIITDTKFIPSDTTLINKKTCDITQAGIISLVLQSAEGCDSIIFTDTKFIPSKTTLVNKRTCDINKAGLTFLSLLSAEGCDSIIITDTKYITSDTTLINKKTCDISKSGITSLALQSIEGCDSIIITNTNFIPSDTINQVSSTCNLEEAGSKTIKLINSYGCDSIVNRRIVFIGSPNTEFTNFTCTKSEVGIKKINLLNKNGCDSTIVLNVVLLPDDSCSKKFEYYFPNIISKNKGINGLFTIYSSNEEAFIESLQIFDRWGNQIFIRNNFPVNKSEYGWDGTFNEKSLLPGVYVYQCSIKEGNEIKRVLGTITLVE